MKVKKNSKPMSNSEKHKMIAHVYYFSVYLFY